MGCESSYQVKIPSKQLNIRIYSTMPQAVSVVEQTLDPYFVTGFTDAEASFTVSIYSEKKDKVNTKIRVMARFKIGLNIKDLSLLIKIQNFFGGIGTLTLDKNSHAWIYSVTSIKDLTNVIIPHFIKYPLLTQKLADFKLFINIVELIKNNAHLNKAGLQQIINIKASMNKGASDFVKSEFSLAQAPSSSRKRNY